jgi:class 3 adenylate cyclase
VPRPATTTILFTDLVNSTELLQRAGEEGAQRVFQAHHTLLKDAVAAHGGQAVKWLGDGLMVAFTSAADAVRCAITMQQTARRPVAGERLAIRVGLNVGEILREETDYFGTPVVVASRLCDHAGGGQIVCSGLVSALLAGRPAFSFRDLGELTLKGIAAPVAAAEVLYQQDDPVALLARTPFVGRTAELAMLGRRLQAALAGQGGVVMLAGEPGIGKTRTLEELAETARTEGALVLWGRCYEGEAGRPWGPFAEALTEFVRTGTEEMLRAVVGPEAAPRRDWCRACGRGYQRCPSR